MDYKVDDRFVRETGQFEVDDRFVRETGQFDLTFIVEKHKIPVSKAVLCIASPVFRAMMGSDFKEKEKKEVCLPKKKYLDVVDFLGCLYPDRLEMVTPANVYGILLLAIEYQVKILEERCQSCLIGLVKGKHLSNEFEIYRHIQLSETYNLNDLNQICTCIASEFRLKEIEKAGAEYPITDHSLIQIHHMARMREELNKNDDFLLVANGITKGTYLDIIRYLIDNPSFPFAYNDKDINNLSSVRLWYRYFRSNKELEKKVIDRVRSFMTRTRGSNVGNKNTLSKQELDLLPEMVKQMLNLE